MAVWLSLPYLTQQIVCFEVLCVIPTLGCAKKYMRLVADSQKRGVLRRATFKPIGGYFSLAASLQNYESGVFNAYRSIEKKKGDSH